MPDNTWLLIRCVNWRRLAFSTPVLAIMLNSCVPPPRVTLPEPFTASGIRVTVDGLYESGSTVHGVDGLAENLSGRDFSACFLNFDVLDEQGVKVGDAIASTTGLAAGQKWRFQAIFTTPFKTRFQALKAGRVQCM